MALQVADRVQVQSTSYTTGSFTLGTTPVTGFQNFTALTSGNTTYYAATDVSGNWEVGYGTYNSVTPSLARTTILSSNNSGAAASFTGTVNIFITYPAEKSVNQDINGLVTSPAYAASNTIVSPTNVAPYSYGTLSYQDTNVFSSFQTSFNGYAYSAVQNTSAGAIASTDFAIYNNNGYYVNAGINSSGYGTSSTTGGTGGVSSTTLTITAVASGNLLLGSVITGTGISGTVTISTQLTATGSAAASPTWVSGGTTGSSTFVISSLANIAIGYLISGTGIPAGTFVGSFTATGNGINLVNAAGSSVNTTANATGTYNFYVPGGVGTYTMSSAQTISNGTTITGQVAGPLNQPNAGYIYSYSGDMVIGTFTSNPIHFVVNNGNTDALTISTAGNVTTPNVLTGAEVVASNGLHVNSQTVSASYSIPSGSSAMSAGPVTLSSGVSVTVPSGSRWVVL